MGVTGATARPVPCQQCTCLEDRCWPTTHAVEVHVRVRSRKERAVAPPAHGPVGETYGSLEVAINLFFVKAGVEFSMTTVSVNAAAFSTWTAGMLLNSDSQRPACTATDLLVRGLALSVYLNVRGEGLEGGRARCSIVRRVCRTDGQRFDPVVGSEGRSRRRCMSVSVTWHVFACGVKGGRTLRSSRLRQSQVSSAVTTNPSQSAV